MNSLLHIDNFINYQTGFVAKINLELIHHKYVIGIYNMIM